MACIDVDPFGEHGKTDEMTDETFPLTPRGGGGMNVVTHAQVHEVSGKQETSPLESLKIGYLEEKVEQLYEILSERLRRKSEEIYFKRFQISHGELCYKDKTTITTLTIGGKLKTVETIAEILGKRRLRALGFVTHVQVHEVSGEQEMSPFRPGGEGGNGPPEGKFMKLGGKVNFRVLSSKIDVTLAKKGPSASF